MTWMTRVRGTGVYGWIIEALCMPLPAADLAISCTPTKRAVIHRQRYAPAIGTIATQWAESAGMRMIRGMVAAFSLALLNTVNAQPATVERQEGASDGAELPSSTTWSYESRGTAVLWASARSDLGTLGEYCNSEVGFCVWILVVRDAECVQGDYHPILLNTDQLAESHIIRCVGSVAGRGATFAFTDFGSINEAVRGAQQLAIAFPGQGDTIVVTHFPLDGATAALERLHEAFKEQSSTTDRDGEGPSEKPSPAQPAPAQMIS